MTFVTRSFLADKDIYGNTLIVDEKPKTLSEEEHDDYLQNWAHPEAARGWELIYDYNSVDGITDETFLKPFIEASNKDIENAREFISYLLNTDFVSELSYVEVVNNEAIGYYWGFMKKDIPQKNLADVVAVYFFEGGE